MGTDGTMTLVEHLGEMRRRIVWSLLVFMAATFIVFGFGYEPMKMALQAPLDAVDPNTTNPIARHNPVVRQLRPYLMEGETRTGAFKLYQKSVMEVFIVKFKMALLGGLLLSSPFLFYQMWAFVGAGLVERERRWILFFFPFSMALFVIGVVFAYFTVIPVMLIYLMNVDKTIEPVLMYGDYFGLTVMMLAMFGLGFQLPLLTMGLAALGIVPAKTLAKKRRFAIVLIFVAAALLTPSPEPFSQCLLAFPMVGLYELGIILARTAEKRRTQALQTS